MVAQIIGKVPPQAMDVEEAVLGSLMLESGAIHDVDGLLNPESFYSEQHKRVFIAIKTLSVQCKPIDVITVTKFLKDKNELDMIGGVMFLMNLTSKVAGAANIKHHARIIQQLFIQRELIKIGSETVTESFDEGADIDDLLSNLKRKISDLEDYSFGADFGKSQKFTVNEAIIETEKDCAEAKKGKQPGITTGLYDLNQATGGWRDTNLIIVAARPGIGKTSLALHFAKVAAKSGKWVNFYGLEMKSSDLMRIQISGESGVSRSAIRDGRLSDQDWNGINACIPNLINLPIIWADFAGITADNIRSQTIKNRKNGRCDIVIIDYLQLISTADKKMNREQQIAEISRTLKRLALSENIPVIALAQLNREAENTKPQLNHLRESGSLEQDADVVIFPWREDGKYQLTIAKNRRGKKGTFEIFANEEMTVFADVTSYVEFPTANNYEIEPNDRF